MKTKTLTFVLLVGVFLLSIYFRHEFSRPPASTTKIQYQAVRIPQSEDANLNYTSTSLAYRSDSEKVITSRLVTSYRDRARSEEIAKRFDVFIHSLGQKPELMLPIAQAMATNARLTGVGKSRIRLGPDILHTEEQAKNYVEGLLEDDDHRVAKVLGQAMDDINAQLLLSDKKD